MEIFVKLLYHHVFNTDFILSESTFKKNIEIKAIQTVHNEAISFMKVVFAGPAKLASPIMFFLSPLSHEVFKSLSLYSLCYGRLKCLKIALTSFKTKSIQVTKF